MEELASDEIKRIKELLLREHRVLLAYLFGSRARGSQRLHSDWDIAVLLSGDDLALEAHLQSKIAKVLNVPEEKVDLVNLKNIPLSMKFKILREGIKLVDRGGFENKIINEVNTWYPEIQLLRELSIKEFLNGNGIDKQVVLSRLEAARGETKYLKDEILKRSIEEILSSGTLRRAMERSVQVLIEALLDVCRHLVSAMGLGPAETYVEFIEKLVEAQYFPYDFGERLKGFVRLRNIIVHRYLHIDYRVLYRKIRELVEEIVPCFEYLIREVLRKESRQMQ